MVASVRLYGIPVGVLDVARDGSLSFRYDDNWMKSKQADKVWRHPISLSMPLTGKVYGHDRAGPFFDGLLPDNRNTRAALARYFQVDASDDYALLYNLGRECPGAVSIVPPDEPVIPEDAVTPEFDLLDDDRLAEHIRNLPRRPLFVDADGEELRLSLPGVHHKAAVIVTQGRVALARGITPTSHILKVDIDGLEDSIRVENFCLKLAGRLGMDVPLSVVREVHSIPYMLIARYDRTLVTGDFPHIRRLHQEDFCQALGRFPTEKYEKDGGPGWRECFNLMNRTGDPARHRLELLNRAIFQFLVNNLDAHAKNYSIVYRRGVIALSKLYDVNNATAFRRHFKEQRPRVAMYVGGERDADNIDTENWTGFAHDVQIRPEFVHERIAAMAQEMPRAARDLREEIKGTPEDSPLLDLVVNDVDQRCERVLSWNDSPKPR